MTQSWGHTFNPNYKSARELIHTLIEVVSKGGNFLLNVAPTPDDTFEAEAHTRLAEIGKWMDVNVKEGSEVTLLGYGSPLPWSKEGDQVQIKLPPELEGIGDHALVFRVEGRF